MHTEDERFSCGSTRVNCIAALAQGMWRNTGEERLNVDDKAFIISLVEAIRGKVTMNKRDEKGVTVITRSCYGILPKSRFKSKKPIAGLFLLGSVKA